MLHGHFGQGLDGGYDANAHLGYRAYRRGQSRFGAGRPGGIRVAAVFDSVERLDADPGDVGKRTGDVLRSGQQGGLSDHRLEPGVVVTPEDQPLAQLRPHRRVLGLRDQGGEMAGYVALRQHRVG